MSSSTAERVVPTGWVVIGVMLTATAFIRWFRSGPGSRFTGIDLADNVRSGILSPSWGIWVALGLYSIVGGGGVFIATAMVRHRAVLVARLVFAALGVVAFVRLAATIPVSNWSAGPTLGAAAFALACCLSTIQLLSPPREQHVESLPQL